ncbi:uncharacterized protein LOC143202476 [Rhynchophorus ferrugineus]|uniref:uncharacterized protein LOC143202476 n=1 Tax=Rhynchophorus ferrugineus TaxID=354439 RepID=UPI003FCCFCCE
MAYGWMFTVFVLIGVDNIRGQVDLDDYFKNCKPDNSESFDDCLKDGLNGLRAYFKTGLPDYGVEPFDPFFASEVHQKRRGPFFDYKLVLHNVTESGWTNAEVTKIKTDPTKNQIQVTQSFPDKRLKGWYAIEGTFLGTKVKSSGGWNLALFNYSQTLTVSRKSSGSFGNLLDSTPIKVKCNLHSCQKLELHIENLAGGRRIIETVLDRIINVAWPPGFYLLSPLINDLVGTAFTEIFTKDFQSFPFDRVFGS